MDLVTLSTEKLMREDKAIFLLLFCSEGEGPPEEKICVINLTPVAPPFILQLALTKKEI